MTGAESFKSGEALLLLGDAIVKPDKHQGREKSDSNSANKQQHKNFLRGFIIFLM
jgi:hypothetical protein